MTPSRTRYLLMTSRGLVGAAPIAAALGYALFSQLSLWRGDWWWGYNSVGQAMPVVVVVTAFVEGWDAGSSSSGYRALVERVPTAHWRVVVTLLAVPLGVALGLLTLTVTTLMILTWSASGGVDARAPLLISSHALMICLAAAIGLQAGRLLASPYAAFTGAAVVGLLLAVSPGRGQHLFGLAGASGAIVGSTPAFSYYAVNIATLLGATLLLVAPLAVRPRAAVVGACLAVAAGGMAVASAAGSSDQFVPAGERATRCRHATLEICVYPGYDRLLPVADKGLDDLLDEAARHGVPATAFPTRFEQNGGAPYPPGVGVLQLGREALRDMAIDAESLAASLSTPLWCPEMFDDAPPVVLLGHGALVRDWLLLIGGDMTTEAFAERHPRAAPLSEAQQAAVIADELGQLRRCDNQ